ncbi:MAG: hypothetical protein LDL13_04625 [Calditerrivibrio sp.]|nr:hypothetical protein [Calditerrivibrio sp.]MCA1932841.1 hypothetical protein [Calditerrivibrio sp.]
MFKYIFLLILVVSLSFSANLFSETADLLSRSKAKIDNLEKIKGVREKSKTVVAGAKATEQVNKDELYWAGKDEVTDDEIKMFKLSLDFIEKGDYLEGKRLLKEFTLKFPKSALLDDSIALLNELEKKK